MSRPIMKGMSELPIELANVLALRSARKENSIVKGNLSKIKFFTKVVPKVVLATGSGISFKKVEDIPSWRTGTSYMEHTSSKGDDGFETFSGGRRKGGHKKFENVKQEGYAPTHFMA